MSRQRTYEPEAPSTPSFGCCAPGCVLPGSIADSTNGSQDWYCAIHHSASFSHMSAISSRIRNRESIFILARRLCNTDPGVIVPGAVKEWILARPKYASALKLKDGGQEPAARTVGSRMLAQLGQECRNIPASESAKPSIATEPAAVLLEGLT